MDLETTGNSFTGSYSYTLDAKGRVNIPSKMRKALGPANDGTFVATRSGDPCIVLYPIKVWKEKLENKLLQLNRGSAINRHFARNLVRHAEIMQYDSQGRVALPANLITFAGIEKDVEIVGMIDRIELWAPERLAEIEARFVDRDEEMETIAREIDL
ncbi:MAG: division/cell wall cluster transcriptional repressor MraZ [Candidatus Neomarinimicrobiota bacterium]